MLQRVDIFNRKFHQESAVRLPRIGSMFERFDLARSKEIVYLVAPLVLSAAP